MFIYIKIEINIMKFKFLLVLAFLGLDNMCLSSVADRVKFFSQQPLHSQGSSQAHKVPELHWCEKRRNSSPYNFNWQTAYTGKPYNSLEDCKKSRTPEGAIIQIGTSGPVWSAQNNYPAPYPSPNINQSYTNQGMSTQALERLGYEVGAIIPNSTSVPVSSAQNHHPAFSFLPNINQSYTRPSMSPQLLAQLGYE
jgi:hypothetical protein